MASKLKKRLKSEVIKKGYINIYSKLSPQEKRQIYYKTLYKKQDKKWDESLVYLSKKLRSLLKSESKVLDIGCGNGNYLIDENRSKIKKAIGIDVDKAYIKKNICLDKIVIGKAERLPFKNNSFDIVMSLWVLEHLKDPDTVVKEIYRVLKPHGKFLFVNPNSKYLLLAPIKLINLLGLNSVVNRYLFGREKEDIFKTYYKASTIKDIKKLIKGKFKVIELRTNYDPSYTSFDAFSFKLTNLTSHFVGNFSREYAEAHIVGILEKL